MFPDTLAVHFALNGVADRWYNTMYYVLANSVLAMLLGVIFFMVPGWVYRSSPQWWNIPRREYWLAPARRTATLIMLMRVFAWLGCSILALMNLVVRTVIIANEQGNRITIRIETIIAVFLVVILGGLVVLHRYFARQQRN
jgi:hypothetical protein